MRHLARIEITEKCKGDWRSSALAFDDEGNLWRLTTDWSETPEHAATKAYSAFLNYENWDVFGFITNAEGEQHDS